MEAVTQTLVVKYGGSVAHQADFLLEDIAYHARVGHKIIVVHGGGPEISHYLSRLGHTSAFIEGQRVTDETTLDVAEMVLAGRVGKRIVRQLQQLGAQAVGISGQDAGMFRCEPFGDDSVLGMVGRVTAVDKMLLTLLLDAGIIPVIAPLAVDSRGQVRNINADTVAGFVAGAFLADAFVLATDVPGVKECSDARTAIPQMTVADVFAKIEEGTITGGMIPKVMAAVEAIEQGARSAWIADGRVAGLLDGVLTGSKVGTRIVASHEERGALHA